MALVGRMSLMLCKLWRNQERSVAFVCHHAASSPHASQPSPRQARACGFCCAAWAPARQSSSTQSDLGFNTIRPRVMVYAHNPSSGAISPCLRTLRSPRNHSRCIVITIVIVFVIIIKNNQCYTLCSSFAAVKASRSANAAIQASRSANAVSPTGGPPLCRMKRAM